MGVTIRFEGTVQGTTAYSLWSMNHEFAASHD
jgi:hypothetical protein